jgi:hypothetical protein
MSGRRSTTTAARGGGAVAAAGAPDNDRDLLSIVPLGAGQEVGRSCIIVKYQLSGLRAERSVRLSHLAPRYFFLTSLSPVRIHFYTQRQGQDHHAGLRHPPGPIWSVLAPLFR